MKKNLKTISILIVCVIAALSLSLGCFFSGSGSELITDRSSQAGSDGDENDTIDDKLLSLRDRLVTAPVILSHVSGEEIHSSGDKELVFIKGLAEAGNTIDIYVNGELQLSGIAVDDNGNFETIRGVEIIAGKNIVELISINPSGNESNPTELSLFLTVPPGVEFSLFEDSESLKEILSPYYSTESDILVYMRGSHIQNSMVSIQVNGKVVGEVECTEDGYFEMDGVPLKSGSNEIAAWAETEEGYRSEPVFEEILVFKDLMVPYPSDLTGYQQSGANCLSWTASIDDNFSSYKLVRSEEPCDSHDLESDDIIATYNDVNENSYVDDDIEEGRAYFYSLWTLDKAGRKVSSDIFAIPSPDYTITMEPVPPFSDYSKGRREWFTQYYEITNLGNVTLNLQPIRVWEKLEPYRDPEMEIAPLWEVHIWNPEEADTYYYSNEEIYETFISDWANTEGTVETEITTDYSSDGLTKTVTEKVTTKETQESEVNLKRLMTTTEETTITETDLTTGIETITTTTDSSTDIVEPDKIGSEIEGLNPGEKIKIAIKIQNVSAYWSDEITVHFNFVPVDCDSHFFIDEIVSTGDITIVSTGRNYQ